eukprot:c273_g1_i1.p1 GENE.c273_g1_i1~~c273_g1_i1.p1  ORF type:complete len:535 (+),score=98.86 c273_g1_i1:30-1607(+)
MSDDECDVIQSAECTPPSRQPRPSVQQFYDHQMRTPVTVSLSQHAHETHNTLVPLFSSERSVWSFSSLKTAKVINDPIHGHMRFEPEIVGFIDTRQFQRLRELKQLGTTYMVYPGASHNRFEHCLGVSHLANTWITHLSKLHSFVTDQDRKLVSLAGLLHDLGHGPFSHVFDNEFIPAVKPEAHFHHEDMSCKMFDWIIDDYSIDMEKEDRDCVKALILGAKTDNPAPPYLRGEKNFLFDIVANGRCSVDVDKFDYIARDAYNSGVKVSCDFSRIWQSSMVIDDEICFHEREAMDLYDLFHTRASLHKRVYTHSKAKAIEYMVRDAMIHADPVLRFSDKITDPEEFWQLTDSILKDIELSRDPALEYSRKLIRRIRDRELYKFCGEYVVPSNQLKMRRIITPDDIMQYHRGSHLKLEDVIVHNMEINYGLKDDYGNAINPLDKCNFFRDWHSTQEFPIRKEKVSTLLVPEFFEEKRVRVFCRSLDAEKHKELGQALEDLSRARKCPSPITTPNKRKRTTPDYESE